MTRQDLRNLCLYWLDDLNAGYFTNTQVNAWLNNAQRECQKQLLDCGERWYLTCATTSTIVNTDCYQVPSDFAKLERLELLVQGTLTSGASGQTWAEIGDATLNEQSMLNYGTAQPSTVSIGKNCIYLRPVPDTSYVMRMYYSYLVSDMNDDTSSPDVPTQYQEYIALLATMDGYIKDNRDPSSLNNKRQYYLDMMKKDQIQRNRSRPRHINRTSMDSFDIGF